MSDLAEFFEEEPVDPVETETTEEVAEAPAAEPTPAVEEAPETPETEPETAEADGAPTAPEEKRETGTVPIAALLDERDKRQAMQRELEQFKAQQAPASQPEAQPEAQAPAAAAPEFPTLESVGYDEAAFQQAVHEYNQRTFDTAFTAHQQKLEAERQEKEMAEKFNSFWTEGAKLTPDFHQKVSNVAYVSDIMRDTVIDSPKGPEVMLYLANQPDVAQHIQGLSPARQAAELGKLEERLAAAPPASTPAAASTAPSLSPSLTNVRAEGGNRESAVVIPDPFETTFDR